MKLNSIISALSGLLLASVATVAFAHHGNLCPAEAEKIKNPAERTKFLKDCLAEEAAETSTAEADYAAKVDRCNQNAKNMKLTGDKKTHFVEKCIKENKAKEFKSNYLK